MRADDALLFVVVLGWLGLTAAALIRAAYNLHRGAREYMELALRATAINLAPLGLAAVGIAAGAVSGGGAGVFWALCVLAVPLGPLLMLLAVLVVIRRRWGGGLPAPGDLTTEGTEITENRRRIKELQMGTNN